MENGNKRKSNDAENEDKIRYTFTENNAEEDDLIMEWLMLDEETAAELSKLLDVEAEAPPVKVKFIDDPYSTPVVFQSSAGYVTINGNEEMCGSSFSESQSSVMASVDMAGLKQWQGDGGGCAWGEGDARGVIEESYADVERFLVKEGFGDVEVDDEEEMWVKFLGEDLF